jgi:uncharacterized protein (TIGR00725 family)
LRNQEKIIVSVFGSSRVTEADPEYRRAYELGAELARAGFVLCNGGYGGTMEASARGAKEAGGQTIGITCNAFSDRGANPWIDRTIVAASMVERLMMLVHEGHAYAVLKGGTGTLLELSAVWEFMNKGVIPQKPIVVIGDFWNSVLQTLSAELAWEGLEECTRFVTILPSGRECVEFLREHLLEEP